MGKPSNFPPKTPTKSTRAAPQGAPAPQRRRLRGLRAARAAGGHGQGAPGCGAGGPAAAEGAGR